MKIGLAGIMVAIGTTTARCAVVIGNLSATNTGIVNIKNTVQVAAGFTMGNSSYTLTGLQVRLIGTIPASTKFELRANSTNHPGTTALVNFTNPTFGTGVQNYSLTPATAFNMQANTTYWLVGYGTTSTSTAWTLPSPAVNPTGGFASFIQYDVTNNSGSTWTSGSLSPIFEIDGTVVAVPEPSTLILVSLAGGAAVVGRWRKRWARRNEETKRLKEPGL